MRRGPGPSTRPGTPPSPTPGALASHGKTDTSPAPRSLTSTRCKVLLWYQPHNGLPIGAHGCHRGCPGEATSRWGPSAGQVHVGWGALALQVSSDPGGGGFSWQQEGSSLQAPWIHETYPYALVCLVCPLVPTADRWGRGGREARRKDGARVGQTWARSSEPGPLQRGQRWALCLSFSSALGVRCAGPEWILQFFSSKDL